MEAPKPFELTAPDRLEIRSGGGCMSVFGVPFLLAGIFIVLAGLQVIPFENAAEIPFWVWPLIGLMGLAFVAAGGALVFGRTWTVIDRSRASITKQWGLLVPMRQTEQSLRDYPAVTLRFDQGDSDSADTYPVSLKAQGGGTDLVLYNGNDYGAAHTRAAFLSKFLALPLEDATTEHTTVLAADQVDAPFQERQRNDNDAPFQDRWGSDDRYDHAPQPMHMRSQAQVLDGSVQITIPGTGFKPTMLLNLVIPTGMLIFIAPWLLRFFTDTDTPTGVQSLFIGFIVLFFGLFPLIGIVNKVIKAKRQRTLVTVTPNELLIEQRDTWQTKTTRIPAAEIMGLDYSSAGSALSTLQHQAAHLAQQQNRVSNYQMPVPGSPAGASPWWLTMLSGLITSKGITVKSRQGLFTFGAGLPDDEVAYLYALVKNALGASV